MIGPTQAEAAGNLSERERSQTHMPEQIKHELAGPSGSPASRPVERRGNDEETDVVSG